MFVVRWFAWLDCTDLHSTAAVGTAQNELSLQGEFIKSVGRKPLSSNLGIFTFPDLGAAKYQIGIWATNRNSPLTRARHTDLRDQSQLAFPSSGYSRSLHRQPRRRGHRIAWSLKVEGCDHSHSLYSDSGWGHGKEK